eukprot:TRINITY_DN25256_c0_g1_i1.p1 TRINITY_DN25256_c0_g1~~TRINITY_DN25256_c0_g1_i1.p1  ORF type:complete len:841 (-),score=119.15 TRINITY_DN25256_c0_g1_i1:51-2315(-)
MVMKPMELCRQVFKHTRHACPDAVDENFPELCMGPVTQQTYHSVIRRHFLEILTHAGLQASSFLSVDSDETFLKVFLARDGDHICEVAERFGLQVPVSSFAYKSFRAMESQPMHNAEGDIVPAYMPFDTKFKDYVEGFRQVDEIRLVERLLSEWVNLDEMVRQNLLIRYFPAANHKKVQKLHSEWANLKHIWRLPKTGDADEIRHYFGENIAFFFHWYAFYCRMLVPLGCLGLFASLRRIIGLTVLQQRIVQIIFGCIVTVWALVFNKLYERGSYRIRQRWGMTEAEVLASHLSSHESLLDGTWSLKVREMFCTLVTISYMIVFAVLVNQVSSTESNFMDDYGPYLITTIIMTFSLLWSKIAPLLNSLQNHKTQLRWDRGLVLLVLPVRLFLALYPFLSLCFLKRYLSRICSPTLAEAARLVYSQKGPFGHWPPGIKTPSYSEQIIDGVVTYPASADSDFSFLAPHSWVNSAGQYCISGCFPAECVDDGTGVHCTSNCQVALERSLLLFFVSHTVATVIFTLIPMVLASISIKQEHSKVSQTGQRYTLLQVQAKSPAYEFQSWGGSKVDDFMELAIGFAIFASFCAIIPVMAFPALISSIIEYRLIAWRMVAITRRPSPLPAAGIGVWREVFRTLCIFVIIINVGTVVMVLYPIRDWPADKALIAFVSLEHVMLFVKVLVEQGVSNMPKDVGNVHEFNNQVLATLRFEVRNKVPDSEVPDNSKVDLSLKSSEHQEFGRAADIGFAAVPTEIPYL